MVGAEVEFRLRAVRQYLDGNVQTANLCRVFGISERTLQGWARRYREEGVADLDYRSRRSYRLTASPPSGG